jgi:hypothetical protein
MRIAPSFILASQFLQIVLFDGAGDTLNLSYLILLIFYVEIQAQLEATVILLRVVNPANFVTISPLTLSSWLSWLAD